MTDIIERRELQESPQVNPLKSLRLKPNTDVDEVDNIDYRFEAARLRSFENWPVHFIDPEKLASAGFYYLGEGDKVRCFDCGIEICQWREGENPMEDHQRWSVRCRFIRKLPCGNVPIGTDPNTMAQPTLRSQDVCGPFETLSTMETESEMLMSDLQLSNTAKLNYLGLGRAKGPIHPDFTSYDARLKTFNEWPKSMPQTKEQLACAGFYYTGKGDQTLCYHCGGGLKDWEPEDDPWEQHAKWFSRCCYLLTVKGQEYVNKVTGQQTSYPSREETMQMSLPSFIKKVEQPLRAEAKPDSEMRNIPGPSCSSNSSYSEAEGSTLASGKGCKSADDARMCKICYNGELGVVFLPCGHMVACVMCAPGMTTCAVCREPVTMTVRAFLS